MKAAGFAFSVISGPNQSSAWPRSIPSETHFGYVYRGELDLQFHRRRFPLAQGMYFMIPGNQGEVSLSGNGACFVVSQIDWQGLFSLGGPIESEGRLKYIDGWFYKRRFKRLDREQFDRWLKIYQTEKNKIKNLITTPSLKKPQRKNFEADIFSYGVERVLLVQRKILVDLLVKNKIHTTNRCVVVSGCGYPEYLSEHVERLLAESPELPIFLLHDADGFGQQWVEEQMEKHQTSNRKIVDAGVSSEMLRKIGKLTALRLQKTRYTGPVDLIPMAMLANGIALSTEHQIPMASMMDQGSVSGEILDFG